MDPPRVRLGELLVRAGLVSRQQLEETLASQKRSGRRLGSLLVESGLVSEAQVTQILSQQLSVPWVSLHHIDFSSELLRLVPVDVVERHCLVPIYVRRVRGLGDALYVAMDDPTNADALELVARHSGLHVRAMIAPPEAIRTAIRENYGVTTVVADASAEGPEAQSLRAPEADAKRSIASFDDDDDTGVHWRREMLRDGMATARRREDSVVDLIDADVVEVSTSELDLAPIDESIITETTGTLSADDPDVIEVSGPDPARMLADRALDPVGAPRLGVSAEPPAPSGPPPSSKGARSLTLLDGTTIALPPSSRAGSARSPAEPAGSPPVLSVQDVVAMLRASARGVDVSEMLGARVQWQTVLAALLAILERKGLVTDEELRSELEKG